MSVSLEVEIAGVTYYVYRSMTKAEVRAEGKELLSFGQTPSTKFIEEKLGISSKVLIDLLCSEQGESQSLLKMGAAGLQKKLEQVADIELIDSVLDLIRSDISNLDGYLQGLKVENNLEVHEKELSEVRKKIQEVSSKLNKASYTLEIESNGKEELSNKISKLERDIDSVNNLRNREEELIKEVTEVVGKIRSLESSSEVVEVPESIIEAKKKELNLLSQEVKRIEKDNALYTSTHNKFFRAKEELKELREIRLRADEILPFYQELKALEEDLEKSKKEVYLKKEALSLSICSLCSRPLEGVNRESLEKALADEERLLQDIKMEKGEVEEVMYGLLAEAEITRDKMIHVSNNYQLKEEEVNKLDIELSNLPDLVIVPLEELKKVEEEVYSLIEKRNNYLMYQQEKNQLDESFKKIKDELSKVVSKLNKFPEGLEESLSDCLTLRTQQDESIKSISNKIEQLRKEHIELLTNETTLKKFIEKERKNKHIWEKTNKKLNRTKELRKYLSDNRSRFLSESWSKLIDYASHLLSITTDGRLTNLSRKEKGIFFVEEHGREIPVSELSGANKSMITICLRTSLSKCFYGECGFTLMDEITADCSDKTSASIAGLLKSVRLQTIMVTHKEGDAINADNIITL